MANGQSLRLNKHWESQQVCCGNGKKTSRNQPKKEEAFPGNGRLTDTEARIRQLERENALLKEDKENPKKSAHNVLEGRKMKYRFIEKHQNKYTIGRICELLGVSRSGFYAWKKRKPSQREQINQALIDHIRRIHRMSRKAYGSPRVYAQLKKQGVSCNQKTVARLMRQDGLKGQRKYRKVITTNSNHKFPIASNVLNREFTADGPNQKWVA